MVDLKVVVDEYTLNKIRAKAQALGVSPDAFASLVVQQAIAQWDRPADGFQEPEASAYDPDEPVYELEDVLTEFSAELERRLALKA
ncbi:MAG: hypothetical protein K2X25_07800 [Caulobacteraceae bacterium]|nr:hypothetical protein [Caulobacteraceae bacterium]